MVMMARMPRARRMAAMLLLAAGTATAGIVACGLLVPGVLLSGCAGVRSIPSPTADLTSVRVSWLGIDALGIEFGLAVKNPYGVELPLTSLDYALSAHDQTFLDGTAALDQRIPAKSTTDVAVPVRLSYHALLAMGQEVVQTRSLPYHASLGLHVATPLLGEIRLPMEKDAELHIPRS